MKVIVISGPQGSGKTTLSLKLQQHFGMSYVKLRFAQPLYDMHSACRNILSKYGIPFDGSKKDGNLLQLLGTEWGRKTINENIWVDCLLNQIRALPHNCVVGIEDCRFENEFDAFSHMPDVVRVRLEASRATRMARAEMWRENENHPSEVGLNQYAAMGKFDLVCDCDKLTEDEVFRHVLARIEKPPSAMTARDMEVLEGYN